MPLKHGDHVVRISNKEKKIKSFGFSRKKDIKRFHFCFVKLNKDFESSGSRFSDTLWSGK